MATETITLEEAVVRVTETYRIPDQNLSQMMERIAKLNKRAAKLEIEPITVTELSEEFELWYRPDPLRYAPDPAPKKARFSRQGESLEAAQARYEIENPGLSTFIERYVTVEISGAAPKLAGWTFIAVLQSLGEEGNILARVPMSGFEGQIPDEYRTRGPVCDHCRMARRRNDTYLVLNEQGEWKQVGRNCLRDFTGHKDPHAIADMAQALADFLTWMGSESEEWEEGGGGGKLYCGSEGFLIETAAVIRTLGWTSRSKARELFAVTSTADNVLTLFHSKRRSGDPEPPEITEADKETGRKALTWARDLSDAEVEGSTSDYLYNLRVICRQEAVESRHLGILASAVASYKRMVELEDLRRHKEAQKPSEHVGEVGKRQLFRVVLNSLREFEGDYGVRTMHRFEDEHGNVLVWWKSGEAEMVEGAGYRITGTVKGHGDYKGILQTDLSRVSTEFATAQPKPRKRPKGTTFKTETEAQAWFNEVKPAAPFCYILKGNRFEHQGGHYYCEEWTGWNNYGNSAFVGWDV